MSQFKVSKSSIHGSLAIPASKSHTLRAILFGALANGTSIITHYLLSTDTTSMIEACRLLGATLEVSPEKIIIHGLNGQITHAEDVINAGNSGIVLRFCSALGALSPHPIVITGDHSIRHQRPIKPLLDALSALGVSTTSTRGDGYAPVIIQGPIQPGKTTVAGEDSQPVSALLIAAAFANGPIELEVINPGEKPWITLTLDWFDRLGIPYTNEGFHHYRLPGNTRYPGFNYHVPGDLSSAAFPIAAALVTGSELLITNIDLSDCQGDKELIDVFRKMGAHFIIDEKARTLRVEKGSSLSGITVDINNFIDAITILAVVACFAEGETRIQNASIAKQKECDRIVCITEELRKMGADITATDDGLIIRKSILTGTQVHSHHDHRMVMSLAVAAMGASGQTTIGSVDCIAKTFPTFMRDFAAIGASIEVTP